MDLHTHPAADAFRQDCVELKRLLLESGSHRLRELMWCGRRVLDICDQPDRYLTERNGSPHRARLSHGFLHAFQPADFKGAFSTRGSKWFLPGLSSSPFPSARSHLASALLRARRQLVEDFHKVRLHMAPHPDHEEVVETGDWSAFIVFGPGGLHPALGEQLRLWCVDLLEHREFCSSFGFCMFLKMGADSALVPHVGSTNMRLRCQLGIRAPAGARATLTVDGYCMPWREGQVIVFDDSYEHSACNVGIADRVVFSLDIWHPEVSAEEVEALSSNVFARFGKLSPSP